MMQYKGYSCRVEFDDEAEIYHGEVIGLRDRTRSVTEQITAVHWRCGSPIMQESTHDFLFNPLSRL